MLKIDLCKMNIPLTFELNVNIKNVSLVFSDVKFTLHLTLLPGWGV